MKISFIVPLYNSKKYIFKCIESITKIKSDEIEIIVVNDGSNDGGEKIVEQLLQTEKRLRLITQSNSGVSSARNRGIREAVGEYLAFVDSDDEIIADSYEELISSNVQDDLICFDYKEKGDSGVRYRKRDFLHEGAVSNQEWMQYLLTNKTNSIWNNVYRRNIIVDNKIEFPLDVRMGEDFLFNMEYSQYAINIEYFGKPSYVYRLDTIGGATVSLKPTYISDYVSMSNALDKYYAEMSLQLRSQWIIFFLNMIFKIMIMCEVEKEIVDVFEKSTLYSYICEEEVKGFKEKIKQIVIAKKGYRSKLVCMFLKKIIYEG